ncbi:hypothetical protein CPB83DRAFT_860056 [Crepidotus variabilis]|uniref:ribonuclease Z n=1 Tax=Crepidotus variabilis TaxID=179855 RepID=A0A9P6E9C1_9AGAR|nr:hypothetical protein CPB83DRAFT_860056 [Crepidotus variabilis]
MTWSSTVHTTISTDTEPSIIVTFADAKYIFNASENTGRAFLQSNRNWRKTKGLFFTQARVEKTSGLCGLIMTLADATFDKLGLYGPPGLKQILASTRFYNYRDSIDVQAKEIPWTSSSDQSHEPCFSDANVTVYPIPALPFKYVAGASDHLVSPSIPLTSSGAQEPELPEKRKRDPSPDSPRKRLNPGNLVPGRMALSEELLRELKKKDVEPATFSGAIADEYRDMILRTMYPNTNPPEDPTAEVKINQKKKSRAGMKRKAGESPPPTTSNIEVEYMNTEVDIDTRRRSRNTLPNGFHKQLPKFSSDLPPSSTPPSMSYLVVGPHYRGKFDVEKARELGVQGRDRGKLTQGETVTFQVKVGEEIVERMVKPEDVLAEPEKPSAILILDTPSPDHIPSLLATFSESEFYRQLWNESGSSTQGQQITLRAIYHLCGDDVLEHEQFRILMKGFGPDVHHIIASKDHCPDPVTFTSAAFSQLRLNSLDEKVFPLPNHSLAPRKDYLALPNLPPKIQLMTSSLHMTVRPFSPPALDPVAAAIDKFHPIMSGSEILDLSPQMQNCVRAAKANVKRQIAAREVEGASPPVGKDVGIIPLGTGGSAPGKYRNVLATLIRIPEWGNILLDTGEGTWGQLARNFGLHRQDGQYDSWQALRDLKCIFVSHIHADHHVGLAHLLARRKMLDPPPKHPLYIVSLRTLHLYLRELSDVQDLGLFDPSGNGVIPILSESLHFRNTDSYPTTGMWQVGGDEAWLDFETSARNAKAMCNYLGLEHFRTADMYHYCRCFGCNFKHKDGWSVSFSGDTMPTDNLVWLGQDSTVLIHEATMANEEADIAKKKGHSTIGQAVNIGKKMNASNILLTHFSGRHPKLPPSVTREMMEVAPDTKHVVVPALDHANLTISEMWKMSCYVPALLINFRETNEADSETDALPIWTKRSRDPPRRVQKPAPIKKLNLVATG